MKRMSLSVLSVAFVSLAACGNADLKPSSDGPTVTASQALTSHAKWSGGAASASYGTEFGGTYVDVSENASGGTRTAWLSYNRWSVDPTSKTCWTETYPPKGGGDPITVEICDYTRRSWEYGYGQIAAADFSMKAGSAQLATSVANGANFYIETCTFDASTQIYACTNSGGGAIALTWHKNGESSQFQNGVSENTYGKYMWRTTGQYRGLSADASGTAFGSAMTATGWLSSSRGGTVSKDIVLAPKP